MGAPQRFIDECQHSLEITIDVIVPEAEDAIACSHQSVIAQGIAPGVRIEIVLPAVELDYQPMLVQMKSNM